jgi:hypothetical protein
VKRWLLFVLGIESQRKLLSFVRGGRKEGQGAGENEGATLGIWGTHLRASELIVARWGGPRLNFVLLGRSLGVWLLSAVFVAMAAGAGAVVFHTVLKPGLHAAVKPAVGAHFRRPAGLEGGAR